MKCTNPFNGGHGETYPCGRCMACKINRSQDWSLRIWHEYIESERIGCFVTLTYSDDFINVKNTLVKDHLQRFLKRFRNEVVTEFKYYGVGEYGDEKNRPHYHMIMIGLNKNIAPVVERVWGQGFVTVSNLTMQRINYVTKYITGKLYGEMAKKEYKNKLAPFAIMSKGIGYKWISKDENENKVLTNLSIRKGGKSLPIPRYYVKKMKTEIPDELWDELKITKAEERDKENGPWGSDIMRTEMTIEERHQRDVDLKARLKLRKYNPKHI